MVVCQSKRPAQVRGVRPGRLICHGTQGLAAWVRPGCWQDRGADLRRSCHLPFGTFTAEQAAGINLFDLLAHGWDISQATGASLVCPDIAWETGLRVARRVIGDQRDLRHYAPELPAPPGAPAQIRFLRYLGRAAGTDAAA